MKNMDSSSAYNQSSSKQYVIAIDLTPVLPHGENGGAKIVAIELCKNLALIAPQIKFYLLTLKKNHDELAALETDNMRRLCMESNKIKNSFLSKVYHKITRKYLHCNVLSQCGIDLIFCPFTAINYRESSIPVVVTINDLQHRYYPDFFTQQEYSWRENYLIDIKKHANKIICISHFVKDSVVKQLQVPESRVIPIHIQLPYRLPSVDQNEINGILQLFSLSTNEFLLYPANFWQHKNHEILFIAFGMYKKAHPDSRLKLVCTGSQSERKTYLTQLVKQMGLADQIVFPGYLAEEQFSGLMQSCRALIFPSFFEGFGMPILEAMALQKPVLCSNTTSLPEIAGSAALYFDPRKPDEIVNAITTLATCNQQQIKNLIDLGNAQLLKFNHSQTMAQQYLSVFYQVISSVKSQQLEIETC